MMTIISPIQYDLIDSKYIDDRLRGYYFYPCNWFQTGKLEDADDNCIGIFLYKTTDFGKKLFRNSLTINVYLPFLFEGLPVKVLNK